MTPPRPNPQWNPHHPTVVPATPWISNRRPMGKPCLLYTSNTVRYAGNGMMRQLFGDVMVPVEQVNGAPRLMNLSELTWRAFGIAPPTQWGTWFTLNGARDAALFIAACLITMLAVIALLRPSVFRASRILWTVSLCGLLLAMVSAAVVIAAEPYGPAAGSVLPHDLRCEPDHLKHAPQQDE